MADKRRDRYQQLLKPSWAPPARIFGPVWTALYALMAVSFGAVFYRCAAGQLAWMTGLPFALNLIFNFSFTPLQFGLHSNRLATADILLILITLVWALQVIRPFLFWVALVNIPYLLWVSFATVLQLTITSMNRGRP